MRTQLLPTAKKVTIALLSVVFVFAASDVRVFAESCPAGVSAKDCAAILNDWVDWIPETCIQSSADLTKLGGYTLPATSGKTGVEAAVDLNGLVADTANPKNPDNGKPITFANTLKSIPLAKRQAYADYYIAMRWTYSSWYWNGTATKPDPAEFNWMAQSPKRILVQNPRTGKRIIAVALEAGPAPWTGVNNFPNNTPSQGWVNPQQGTPLSYTGRVSGLPPKAIQALGAVMGMSDGTGDVLTYSWSDDQTLEPGPLASVGGGNSDSQTNLDACPSGVVNGAVFISQRDPKWAGQNICWDTGCGSIHDEGCWASSVAMIISTFTGHNWPNVITPMQTEGNQRPHMSFDSARLKESGKNYTTPITFAKGLAAVQNGSLLLIHGTYGAPFYFSGNHWEVVRGITADGKRVLVNDPWDVPLPNNSAQPNPTQYGRSGDYKAHTLTEYPISDFYHSSDYFYIVSKG